MVRLLMWKFLFWALDGGKWLFRNRGPRVWHFAYGANLDAETLRARGINVLKQDIHIIEDYGFSFSHPGPYQGQGFADLQKELGAKTFGKRYCISKWDMLRFHMFELSLIFNSHRIVWAKSDTKPFYFYQGVHTSSAVKPFCAYRDKIVKAYQASNVTLPDYAARIENHPCLKGKLIRSTGLRFFKSRGWYPAWVKKIIRRYDYAMGLVMGRIYPHKIAGQ